MAQPRELWKSRIGLVLATAGNAIGLGNFIRNPRKTATSAGVKISSVLKIEKDHGDSFQCFPVQEVHSGRVVLNTKEYIFIPKDQNVEQVTI
ncbi:MAG: hypothetical protein IH991_03855 [Planctomycetes bacterium]|nr:hypothetical protein [Planctomycetota bacterium]